MSAIVAVPYTPSSSSSQSHTQAAHSHAHSVAHPMFSPSINSSQSPYRNAQSTHQAHSVGISLPISIPMGMQSTFLTPSSAFSHVPVPNIMNNNNNGSSNNNQSSSMKTDESDGNKDQTAHNSSNSSQFVGQYLINPMNNQVIFMQTPAGNSQQNNNLNQNSQMNNSHSNNYSDQHHMHSIPMSIPVPISIPMSFYSNGAISAHQINPNSMNASGRALANSSSRSLLDTPDDDIRRARHIKSPAQMKALKFNFLTNPKPTKDQMKKMMKETACSYSEICRWFRNERHKEKKAAQPNTNKQQKGIKNAETSESAAASATPPSNRNSVDNNSAASISAASDAEDLDSSAASPSRSLQRWLADFNEFPPQLQLSALEALSAVKPQKRSRELLEKQPLKESAVSAAVADQCMASEQKENHENEINKKYKKEIANEFQPGTSMKVDDKAESN